MKTIPNEIKADGLKLYAKLGGLDMPLDDETIKHHCGHIPKSEMEAKVMARRLKGKLLEFPNIGFGKETKWDKRQKRIERRKRKERNVMKVNLRVKIDSDTKKHELFAKLLEVEGIKKIKKIGDSSIEFETDRKIGNNSFGQKEINEMIIKKLEEDFEEIKEISDIDYQD